MISDAVVSFLTVNLDNIKIDLSKCPRRKIIDNTSLEVTQRIEVATASLKDCYRAKWEVYRIQVYKKKRFLTGSITKSINYRKGKGRQNYDDVTFVEMVEELKRICDYFGLDPNDTIVQNLEYNVNVRLDKSPKALLVDEVIAWDCRVVNRNENFDNTGKYYEWKLVEYLIKLYDKSAKEGLPYHLLRFEKKVIVSRYMKQFGIVSLADLFKESTYKALGDDLIDEWNKLLMVTQWNYDSLPKRERKACLQQTNQKYLERYREGSNTVIERKEKSRNKKILNEVVKRYDLDRNKQLILSMIIAKLKK